MRRRRKEGEPGECTKEYEEINLKRFQFDFKEAPNPTILLVAKRNSGKSFTGVSIAEKFTHVERWSAFCGNKQTESYWSKKFGSSCSVKGIEAKGLAYLKKLISYQQEKIEEYELLNKPLPKKYELGIILDDVTADKKFSHSQELKDLLSNGRHYHITLIICCQYLKQLPPEVRTNFDYIFMLHNGKNVRKLLHTEYLSEPDYDVFTQIFEAVVYQKDSNGKKMYNSLVYDNAGTNNVGLENIFKIYYSENAEYISNAKIGSDAWREYNRVRYVDEKKELQRKKIKKLEKLEWLKSMRDSQLMQRGLVGRGLDVDTFSDSDSDSDSDGC